MPANYLAELTVSAIALAIGWAILAVVHVSRPQGTVWQQLLPAVHLVGRLVTALALLGFCLLLLGGLGFVAWVVLIVLWIRAVMNYRAMQRRNLLSALALAAEKEMPLASVARAFSREQAGPYARRVDELATSLEHGATLDDLPARWRAILPPEVALAVRVGLQTGDLNGALKAANYSSAFDRSMLQPVIGRFVYFGVVIVYMVVILSFLFIKVMPSYVKIFDDFSTSLPPVSISLIYAVNGPSPWFYIFIVLALFIVPIYIWLQWRGTLMPRLPGLARVINWVDMAPILRMFALATRHGRPLGDVVRSVAELHPKRSVRARMWPVAFDTDDGRAWQESLARRNLVSANDAALLAAAQRNGNLVWAFGETASSYERRASLYLQALAQIVLPLAMVPIGLIVAWVALAYFTPLVQLISGLS